MRPRYLFLLVYLLPNCWAGKWSTESDEADIKREPDSTSHFLQCVGLPSTDTGKDHMRRLKEIIEASLDVYTFMRSSMAGVPLLSLQGLLAIDFEKDPYQDETLVQMWLEIKLQPLLKSITQQFLSCLSTKKFSCSTYQIVVKELSHHFSEMDPARQKWIYTFFMYPFLSGNGVAGCAKRNESSEEWLMKNFGSFKVMARMKDFLTLNMDFICSEVLHLLSPEQKAELLLRPEIAGLDNATLSLVLHSLMTGGSGPHPTTGPGDHNWTTPNMHSPRPTYDPYLPASPQDTLRKVLNKVIGAVKPIGNLIHDFVSLTHERDVSEIRSTTITQVVLNWTLAELAQMFRKHKTSEMPEKSKFDVANVEDWYRQVVMPILRKFLTDEQSILHENIRHAFLRLFYLDFGKRNQTSEVQDICSITLEESSCGLTDAITNVAHVLHCVARSNLTMSEKTIIRLVSELTKRLNSLVKEFSVANFSEVVSHFQEMFDQVDSQFLTHENLEDPHFISIWFQIKLLPLLPEIPISLLSCLSTKKFTCPVYQTLVAELSRHMQLIDGDEIYSYNIYKHFIHPILLPDNYSMTMPKCYNASNPEMNSTAWFAEYISSFIDSLTLEDLLMFGPSQVLQTFAVNSLNIALLNQATLPLNVTNYYTQLVYQHNNSFNPLLLPVACRCFAPALPFTQLNATETMIILPNLTMCSVLGPQVPAALASNFNYNINATIITALGKLSIGISTGQFRMVKPAELFSALSTLRTVPGWNDGQVLAIVQLLMSSGMIQVNSSTSLLMLGTLVAGLPTSVFSNISGSELIAASMHSAFLTYLMSGPVIIQQIFVAQIISVDSSSEAIIQNVPDEMATEIPRVLLQNFSDRTSVITTLNRKKWNHEQAVMFFEVLAAESATAVLGGVNNLSSSVLQGFTCTTVRTFSRVHVKNLIKACRRKGNQKVQLVETQLTCMYNYIKGDAEVTSYHLFPQDVLLYYDYSLVPQATCKSYFEQLGDADFSVFSVTLSYKKSELFSNAKTCLGITQTNLTKDIIAILGNMCCILDGSYIVDSDPLILEKLKSCSDLTSGQVTAVETQLASGRTLYGSLSTWNEQTLENLGMLASYLNADFYNNFNETTKQKFLSNFLRSPENSTSRATKGRLKSTIRQSINKRTTRSTANECTVGEITQVTISDPIFPFNYNDLAQFNCCLSAKTVKDNLAAMAAKMDQEEYFPFILSKLREAYSASSSISEHQVQVLGPVSCKATIDDINMWTITTLDTLAALTDSDNCQLRPSQTLLAIMDKYLNKEGNKLGRAEISSIGENLCYLPVDTLKNISQNELKHATVLTLSLCTTEKKKVLFNIADKAFTSSTRSNTISTEAYLLMKPYLGGGSLEYILALADSRVNMDMSTFISLASDVVLNLTVADVEKLLGNNKADLKLYENHTIVLTWIKSKLQSELDRLGIGLGGGKVDPTNTTTTTTNTTTITTTTTSTTTTTTTTAPGSTGSATTTGDAAHIRADTGLSLLALLTLLITSQHIVQ